MNFASILVLGVVAGLFVAALLHIRRTRKSGCGGSCGSCSFPCERKQ